MTHSAAAKSSSDDVHDNREKSRRQAVAKTKIYLKIFFNGKEVCQTAPKALSEDFVVHLGQIYPLQIVQWPRTLKLQVKIKIKMSIIHTHI